MTMNAIAVPQETSAREAELQEFVARLLTKAGVDEGPPATVAELTEHYRLSILYSGEFVVYTDEWDESGPMRVLIRRNVLHHSRDLTAAQDFIESCPDPLRSELDLSYVDEPPPEI
jgi:hypothetical protein